jgi:hypothetical protein
MEDKRGAAARKREEAAREHEEQQRCVQRYGRRQEFLARCMPPAITAPVRCSCRATASGCFSRAALRRPEKAWQRPEHYTRD